MNIQATTLKTLTILQSTKKEETFNGKLHFFVQC